MKQLLFTYSPLPHPNLLPRHIGATLGTAMNNFNSSLKKVLYSTT